MTTQPEEATIPIKFHIFGKDAMFFRVHLAEVTVGSGKDKGAQVEISSNVSGGSIIVRFPDKTYVLGLAAIMDALLKHREGGE